MADTQKKKNVAPVRCVWGHMCSLSSIDLRRKNISLFNIIVQLNFPRGVFDQYQTTKKIVLVGVPQFEIFLLWMRTVDINGINDELPFEFKLRTFDPSGQVIQETAMPAVMPTNSKRHTMQLQMNVVPITVPGDYHIDIEVKIGDNYIFSNQIPLEIKAIS